jgi:hypothetical protein
MLLVLSASGRNEPLKETTIPHPSRSEREKSGGPRRGYRENLVKHPRRHRDRGMKTFDVLSLLERAMRATRSVSFVKIDNVSFCRCDRDCRYRSFDSLINKYHSRDRHLARGRTRIASWIARWINAAISNKPLERVSRTRTRDSRLVNNI